MAAELPKSLVTRTIYSVRVVRGGWLDRALFWNNPQIDCDPLTFAYEKAKKLGLENVFKLSPGQSIENQHEDGVYLCALEHVYGKPHALRVGPKSSLTQTKLSEHETN